MTNRDRQFLEELFSTMVVLLEDHNLYRNRGQLITAREKWIASDTEVAHAHFVYQLFRGVYLILRNRGFDENAKHLETEAQMWLATQPTTVSHR